MTFDLPVRAGRLIRSRSDRSNVIGRRRVRPGWGKGVAMSTMDKLELKALVGDVLNRRPAVGLAVGVVHNGSLEFFHGHGVADIGSNTPIDEDTVFRIAS